MEKEVIKAGHREEVHIGEVVEGAAVRSLIFSSILGRS
jgi:hypothetical protein